MRIESQNVKRILVGQGNRQEPEKEDIKIYLRIFPQLKSQTRILLQIQTFLGFTSYNSSLFPFLFRQSGKRLSFIFPRFVLNLDLNVFMLFIYDMKSASLFYSRFFMEIMILFYKLSVKQADVGEQIVVNICCS